MQSADSGRQTELYLLRHAATDANLCRPPRLQGRRHNSSLARVGVRQAERTRDALAHCTFQCCYCSPMQRAVQTARIICEPHRLEPRTVSEFTECDVGRWEGMDWQTVRYLESENYQRFMSNPAQFGYPSGESFTDVYERAAPKLDELLRRHWGETILVVAHHVVNRTYLARLMGLPLERARQVSLSNCGISVIVRDSKKATMKTLDATDHLSSIAA